MATQLMKQPTHACQHQTGSLRGKATLRAPTGRQCRVSIDQRPRLAAARSNDAGSWGEGRPDWVETCLDQTGSGMAGDLDAEWQAFLASNGRQPQPLIWSADSIAPSSRRSSSHDSSSSSPDSGDTELVQDRDQLPSTSNRGAEASCSQQYTSSIQSFDDWDFVDDDVSIPLPCNLPAGEARQHANSSSSSSSISAMATPGEQLWPLVLPPAASSREVYLPSDLLGRGSLWHSLREVYVLLFGVGQKDTEGIYSLRAVSDDGLPTETIIAFENMDDAIRYSGLLEATMEHSPYVCSIPPAELMTFCAESGYLCRLELEGSLLMPPDYNVHITDWERSLRLREGKFFVLPEEPDYIHRASTSSSNCLDGSAGAAEAASAPATPFQPGSSAMQQASSSSSSPSINSSSQLLLRPGPGEMTAAQLNTVKAQLEALLPTTSSCDEEGWWEYGA